MRPVTSPFRGVATLSLVTATLTYLLVVLGNLVRSTNSGLSYLTWPLYHGRLVPDREFHILMEFSHRAVAGALSLLLVALAVAVFRRAETRTRLGALTVVALLLVVAQIVLGALTVWKLLSPAVVTGHLATAVALFAAVLWIHLVASRETRGPGAGPAADAAPPAGPARAGRSAARADAAREEQALSARATLALAALAVYGQMILGALVSTQHAGLAVPDFPTANGRWFPPLEGLVGVQMIHRYGAYVLTAVLAIAAWRAGQSEDSRVRAGARWAVVLVLVQVALGALNVLWRLPVWLSALHLANAEALLAVCVVTAFRASPERPARSRRAAGPAPAVTR
ncbi:MAG TPA: COX15/CtaA family protein [Candidatus Saccharimonadales bacterium]|nr:COX15/CtaA family protein [Candidatus Saccharimonadales bacterium]